MKFHLLFFALLIIVMPSACGQELELHINILKKQVSYLEPLPIQINLINKGRINKIVYELYAGRVVEFEFKKLGSMDWRPIGSFNAENGLYFEIDYYPKNMSISSNDTLTNKIGIISWIDDGGKSKERYHYLFKEKGIYEIRAKYFADTQGKVIYSDKAVFEVANKYDSYGGGVIDYLESLKIPHYMYDPFTYGNYFNNEFFANSYAKYIISHFGKSDYAAWAKLFLVESKLYTSEISDTEKELTDIVNSSSNPLILEKIKTLLEYLEEEKSSKR